MAISFTVLGAAVVLFVWNRIPVELVAVGAALTLYGTGVLDLPAALAGFGDPTVIFIATLFVVSEGLDAGGVTAWAGRRLVRGAGGSSGRLLVLVMLLVAAATAFISVNGAVAALVPVAVMAAIRLDQSPSRLLLPLVFAAHAGSLLALTGTPVNVIVSDAAVDAGAGRFGYFDFALVGVPLLAGTVAIVLLFGDRLVPGRTPRSVPPDFSDHARTLVRQYGAGPGTLDDPDRALFTRDTGVAEVVVPPRSGMIGATVFPGMVTDSGTLVVLAVQRRGEDLGTAETVLEAGDTLLLEGSWDAFADNLDDPDVLVVDPPELVRRQTAPMGRRGRLASLVLAGMVALLLAGVTPVVSGLLAAGALILLRVLTVPQAYKAVSWTTVVLVGGMIPLSTAMQQSGAAERMAELLVSVVGHGGPYLLLFGLCVLTATLGQLISNTATALIVIPIAVSAAADAGVSARPLLMAVSVAAAASFLTPVATPANLMVMGPGGYRFGDYWELGLPLLVMFVLVGTFLVPLFWSF
ncbi:MAG TPA: SLC13 family permease [Mycobacteriales bacterium]|nr:SLC13 family permease [Mycobacteriales bacterium]